MEASILIIEDSPTSRVYLESLLVKNGYTVTLAKSGEEGLQLADSEQFTLILLDIIMEGMDGLATCHKLKEQKQTKSIPVIFLTVKSDEHSINQGLKAGAVDFLSKPVNEKELLLRVKIHVNQQQRQKALKNALSKSEQQFKIMLEYTYNAEFFRDATGKLLYVSAAFERIFGYNREQYLAGKIPLKDFVHPEDFDETYKQFLYAQQQKVIADFEFRIYKPDGSIAYLAASSQPVYDDAGAYTGNRISIRDITRQKEAEKATIELQERYRSLVENTSDWIWEVDTRGMYTYSSPQVKNILGREPGEILNKSTFDLMPPDERKRIEAFFHEKLKRREGFQNLINIAIHKNGHYVYLDTNAIPVFDRNGTIIAYRGVDRDITKRRHTEQALRESEEKLRLLAENVGEVFWLRSPEQILYINPAYEKIWQQSREALYADPNSFLDSIVEQDRHRVKQAGFKLLKRNIPMDEEFRIQRPDGEIRWIRLRSVPIKGDAMLRSTGVATDITEKKQAEEALLKSKEKAEIANKSKTSFIANISHEIKTPLNAIIGFAEVLYAKTDMAYHSYIDTIMENGRSLQNIFNDILNFAEFEQEKKPLDTREVNIHKLIREIKMQYKKAIEDKGLDYEVHIDEQVPRLLQLDRERFSKIIGYLLDNAAKFTHNGSINMHVHAWPSGDSLIDLYVEVKDTGIGIPEDFKPKLFEPFQQLDNELTRNYKGIGLGLTIAKDTARQMNGDISVKSTLRQGSIFTVVLKAIPQIASSTEQEIVQTEEQNTLFLVGNPPENWENIKKHLAGYHIKTENPKSVQEFAAHLNSTKPALIMVTDAFTKDVAEWLHAQNFSDFRIPLLALTAKKPQGAIGSIYQVAVDPEHEQDLIQEIEQNFPEIREQKTQNEIPEELHKWIPEILKKLEDEPMALWNNLQKHQSIGDVKKFSDAIAETGKQYNMQMLTDYAQKIADYTASFDIVQINKLLQQFPEIINQLKNRYANLKI